jgi:cell wall assembly regulator SMI1
MTEILERADLDAFGLQLRDLRLPVVRYLRPGLSSAELDRAEARIEFPLPGEARTWFGWHDGVDPAPWPPEQQLGGLHLLTLEDAIRTSREKRRVVLDGADGDEELANSFWRSRWLSLAVPGYEVELVIDCGGPIEAPAPVFVVDWQDRDQVAAPRCGSMKELVARWSSGLERGSWKWNIETRNWDIRVDDVPGADATALLGSA